MRKNFTLKSYVLILSLILVTACDENGQLGEETFRDVSPQESAHNYEYNENGELVVRPAPRKRTKWEDPELNKIEELIRESREKRAEERLKTLKDERIRFSNVSVVHKKNGQKEVTVVVEFQDVVTPTVFISPENHGKDFLFILASGFKAKKISLQGACVDFPDCFELRVLFSYIVEDTKYTEEFDLSTPIPEPNEGALDESEEDNKIGYDGDGPIEEGQSKEPNSEEYGDIYLDHQDHDADSDESKKDLNEEDVVAENLNQVNSSPEAMTEIDALEKKKFDEDDSRTEFNLSQTDQSISRVQPQTLHDLQSPSLPNIDTKPHSRIGELESDSETPPSPTVMSEPPELSYEKNNLNSSPVNFREPKEDDPVQGRAKPEGLSPATDQDSSIEEMENPPPKGALQNSLRPVARPEDLGTTHSDRMNVGAGRYVFPDLGEAEGSAKTEFNVNTGEEVEIETPEESSTSELLDDIRNQIFDQSKRFYSRHNGRNGKIESATLLDDRIKGAKANPNRRRRQYASGLLTKTLEYTIDEFHKLYPDVPVCINDLSAKNGGRLSGHASHQNGLDADVSMPSTGNSCRGNVYFINWSTLDRDDDSFRQKNWDFLKILVSTERVNTIFTSQNFINALCRHVKKSSTKASREEIDKVFAKLRHESGHHRHYHIRMKCNKQNPGCITQPLSGNTCR